VTRALDLDAIEARARDFGGAMGEDIADVRQDRAELIASLHAERARADEMAAALAELHGVAVAVLGTFGPAESAHLCDCECPRCRLGTAVAASPAASLAALRARVLREAADDIKGAAVESDADVAQWLRERADDALADEAERER
jgi:hypothetical protein